MYGASKSAVVSNTMSMHLHSIATAGCRSIDVLFERLLEVLVRLAASVDDCRQRSHLRASR